MKPTEQMAEDWIKEWAEYHHDLIKEMWGKDGKQLLMKIQQYAGIESKTPTTHHFAAFWAEYPKCLRKVDKAGCERIWSRYHLDDIHEDVLQGLAALKASNDWNKNDRAYVPAPSVFLNQRRWEAVTEASTSSSIFSSSRKLS